jgi:hypothetical protein
MEISIFFLKYLNAKKRMATCQKIIYLEKQIFHSIYLIEYFYSTLLVLFSIFYFDEAFTKKIISLHEPQ